MAMEISSLPRLHEVSSVSALERPQTSSRFESPAHTLEFDKQVLQIEFSPFEWSHEVVCVVFQNKVVVGSVKFQEDFEDLQGGEIAYETVEEFATGVRVDSIALSPETTLREVPKCVLIACGTADFAVRIFNSGVKNSFGEKVLLGHKKYVNAVAYDTTGEFLGSVSDDLTCKIWSARNNYEIHSQFYLCSEGMQICWHEEKRGKFLVGERNGTIRMYCLNTGTALFSLRSDLGPLSSVDWSRTNSSLIAALCGPYLLVWLTNSVSSPSLVRSLHEEGGRKVKFSNLTENKLVTLGCPDNAIKVTFLKKEQTITVAHLKLARGITWHQHLGYFAVGVDNLVYIWKA